MQIKNWNIENITGYKPITTFYQDFSIADIFGLPEIRDTYKRAFESWKNDYKYLTELVLALNWKIWEHYEEDEKMARLYHELWQLTHDYAREHLKGDELSYYYRTID